MPAPAIGPTGRSALRRKRERGDHDRTVVNAILDEGLVCHVGFSAGGSTYVTPMAYARIGDDLYLHGAPANRTLRALAEGAEACVTVTLLDGIVLARSAFHHSMNFRSVMLFGRAEQVADPDEQRRAAAALADHLAPGRSRDARGPNDRELRSVLIVRFPIAEGSAKVRTGPPLDDEDDLGLPVWAGEVPLRLESTDPVPDPALGPGVPVPAYVTGHRTRSPDPGPG
ncbi:MAG TPA: pyridoxamine 5'-phosphate oxidase family protein [Acidimicrobiales bacterium]|nr:pyridoxamine 5'-phosphate oxidase family protein [Acidimicrobiales bacterium]